MIKNYIVIDLTVIKDYQGNRYDLHNDFLIKGYTWDSSFRRLTIRFDSTATGKLIDIEFFLVSRYRIDIGNNDEESRIISHIGYLPPEEFGNISNFIEEPDHQESHHMLIQTEDNGYIMVEAGSSEVRSY